MHEGTRLSSSVTLHLKKDSWNLTRRLNKGFFFFFFFSFETLEGTSGDEISFKECDEDEGWRKEGMSQREQKRECDSIIGREKWTKPAYEDTGDSVAISSTNCQWPLGRQSSRGEWDHTGSCPAS